MKNSRILMETPLFCWRLRCVILFAAMLHVVVSGCKRNRVVRLLAAALLAGTMVNSRAATTTYVIQTGNFNAGVGAGGGYHGWFNNSATEVGVYANGAGDSSWAGFQTFTTGGIGAGTARSLKVGDTFSITFNSGNNPYSRLGLALRSSTTYDSFSQIDTADEMKFQLDSAGGVKVYAGAGYGSGVDSNLGAGADDQLTVKITSASTFNASVTRSGTTYNYYDVPMYSGNSISSFGIFLVNDNGNTYWKNGSLTDSGVVDFGTGNGTSTITGLITDGVSANSTTGVTPNSVIKNGSGTITLANPGNNYSGGTFINNGVLAISSDGNLGATTGGVSLNGGINSVLSISSSLTLNAARPITIGANGGKLDAGNNNLTINGSLTNNSGNNHLFILAAGNTTLAGNLVGAGDIVKQGGGTLTFAGLANTFGTATANFYLDNGSVQGTYSSAFGQTSNGGGFITMGADSSANNGPTSLLLTSPGTLVANRINVRHFSGFNAIKIIGGNNASGTVTYTGNIILNDSVYLTNTANGTVEFDGVIQSGTASGGQDINGTPGITLIGFGNTTLTGANTYTGNTTISGGSLALSGNGAIAGANISVANDATFNVSGINAASYNLNSSGTFSLGVNKAGATLSQGQMVLGGKSLAYGGVLAVMATGDALASGDSFTLFSGSTFSGWFSTVSLPALSGGLAWDTNHLATAGILDVYNFTTTALSLSTPMNSNAVVSAAKLANHASSAKGTAVAISASAPAHGMTSISAGDLTYTPATGYTGGDAFTVTFGDGHGTQTMTVSVTVGTGSGASPNLLGQMVAGSNFVLRFAGFPGENYTVETNAVVGPGWGKLGNYTTPSDGTIWVTNAIGTNSLFFRTVWPAY